MELFDKNLEKLHAKLLAVSVVVEKLDPKPALEKIENVLRQKLQSVSEDVNLNRGQAHSLHKDEVTLLKSMEKMLIHLQMACRCPWHKWEERCRKPQWTVRARREPLDLLLALGETQKEHGEWLEKHDQSLLEFSDSTNEHAQKTQELGITIFELRDRFAERL